MIRKYLLLIIFLMATNGLMAQKFDSLAMTPPMGWNSWNSFRTSINENLIKEIADKIATSGLKEAGYQYVVLDDGWMAMERDKNGYLQANPAKFPGGLKMLAEYIHSKGLKFGIYNCAGRKTCAGYPGGHGYEEKDAEMYAYWGVDYLKYDWCNTHKINAEKAYKKMSTALLKTGRPVVFSICEWGKNSPWNWAKGIGHLWRVSVDITKCWDCVKNYLLFKELGVWQIINLRKDIRKFAGPGHWNDLDMMEVGNGFTAAEDRSHFAMWCMLASPLMMGNDLRNANEETIRTLTNREVIAVNQDTLGIPAFRIVNQMKNIEMWAKPLVNGNWALVIVNKNDKPTTATIDWSKLTIRDDLFSKAIDFHKQIFNIRDLFVHNDLGDTKQVFQKTIGVHDVCMLRIVKQN